VTRVPPFEMPVIRPRCVLRWRTLRGINMIRQSSLSPPRNVGGVSWCCASAVASVLAVPAVELGRLVVLTLAGAALDLFLFGEEALELGVGLLDQRRGLLDHVVGGALHLGGLAGGTATAATRGHDATLRTLAR